MPDSFPLDLTGTSPLSKVTGELHTVSESCFRDYFFIVPIHAPFYIDNFSATISINSVVTPLIEDVHYSFCLPYISGTRVTGKPMYGAITLHNLDLAGIIELTYQTIGDGHNANRMHVLTCLADRVYNPRTTVWDTITDAPAAFPPTPHFNDYDSFYGQEELIAKLNEIKDAILANSSLTANEIQNFLNSLNIDSMVNYVKKAGDTMSGQLTLELFPTNDFHAVNRKYVTDKIASELSQYANSSNITQLLANKVDKAGDTMIGPLTLHGNPVQNRHAVTKEYLDNQVGSINNSIANINNNFALKAYVDDKFDELKSYLEEVVLRMHNMGGR